MSYFKYFVFFLASSLCMSCTNQNDKLFAKICTKAPIAERDVIGVWSNEGGSYLRRFDKNHTGIRLFCDNGKASLVEGFTWDIVGYSKHTLLNQVEGKILKTTSNNYTIFDYDNGYLVEYTYPLKDISRPSRTSLFKSEYINLKCDLEKYEYMLPNDSRFSFVVPDSDRVKIKY